MAATTTAPTPKPTTTNTQKPDLMVPPATPSVAVVDAGPCKHAKPRDLLPARYLGSTIVTLPNPESARRVVMEASQRILDRSEAAAKKGRKVRAMVKNCQLYIGAPTEATEQSPASRRASAPSQAKSCTVLRMALDDVLRVERMAVAPGSKKRTVLALLCRHQRPGRELALAAHVLVMRTARAAETIIDRIAEASEVCRIEPRSTDSGEASDSEADTTSLGSSTSSGDDDDEESGILSDYEDSERRGNLVAASATPSSPRSTTSSAKSTATPPPSIASPTRRVTDI